jgi:hypothetical protein
MLVADSAARIRFGNRQLALKLIIRFYPYSSGWPRDAFGPACRGGDNPRLNSPETRPGGGQAGCLQQFANELGRFSFRAQDRTLTIGAIGQCSHAFTFTASEDVWQSIYKRISNVLLPIVMHYMPRLSCLVRLLQHESGGELFN